MKHLIKKFIIAFLKKKAAPILTSGAKIIAVTGSMGKTTTKNALVHILSTKYTVLASEEGFNTPIGILLTLLGENQSGFSSVLKWWQILHRVARKQLKIPDIIVLEFGVDKPGDMDELLDIVQPHYAIVTNVAPVHMDAGQFESMEQIAAEKMKLPKSLSVEGIALLNFDDPHIQKHASEVAAKIFPYGVESGEYSIQDARQLAKKIVFSIESWEGLVDFEVPLFGIYHASVFTPAILLARECDISFTKSAKALQTFQPPPGRGRILTGKGQSVIWDSSYNSNPTATTAALQTLPHIPAKRRFALLGNMNELGDAAAQYHEELGAAAAEYADRIFFIGQQAEHFQKGVGDEKPLQIFDTALQAGKYLAGILQEGDVILVKGSQNGVFLERAVAQMLEDERDRQLLCRQGEDWKMK